MALTSYSKFICYYFRFTALRFDLQRLSGRASQRGAGLVCSVIDDVDDACGGVFDCQAGGVDDRAAQRALDAADLVELVIDLG